MYLTGIFRVLYFNGFPSLRTIHGLKLDDEPIYFCLGGIDGDDLLTCRHQHTGSMFIPVYFSMLFINNNEMSQTSRSLIHESVSSGGKIDRWTRRIRTVDYDNWPPVRTPSALTSHRPIIPRLTSLHLRFNDQPDDRLCFGLGGGGGEFYIISLNDFVVLSRERGIQEAKIRVPTIDIVKNTLERAFQRLSGGGDGGAKLYTSDIDIVKNTRDGQYPPIPLMGARI